MQYRGRHHPVPPCGKALFLLTGMTATWFYYALIVPYGRISSSAAVSSSLRLPQHGTCRQPPEASQPQGISRCWTDCTARHDPRSSESSKSTHLIPRNSVMSSRCGCSDQWTDSGPGAYAARLCYPEKESPLLFIEIHVPV